MKSLALATLGLIAYTVVVLFIDKGVADMLAQQGCDIHGWCNHL